jgi:branched-subunit amino acid transport protein
MSLLEWIDYGLIVVFFVTMAGLVVVIARPSQKEVAASPVLPPVRQNKMTYVVLAILCLFFLSMALLSSKGSDTQ